MEDGISFAGCRFSFALRDCVVHRDRKLETDEELLVSNRFHRFHSFGSPWLVGMFATLDQLTKILAAHCRTSGKLRGVTCSVKRPEASGLFFQCCFKLV